jgi:hypothetical protein
MTDKERLDAAMKKILSVSKEEIQRRIEAEKRVKEKPSQNGPTRLLSR